ncbi:hypothetical protein FTUN_8916 [Frigoriglobus tundricola]|uniref:Uncharacterized protein n=2 Tax=Frigoriglobus tundricola TaxID=2774151 RepID=A0A6M5Z7B7_9BACT|nr:hypothetical protein [Frigoriglobus tundricola]QJX01274.1 hypothetical protein FTUN_8916 [Frigoriglobus tundricola]
MTLRVALDAAAEQVLVAAGHSPITGAGTGPESGRTAAGPAGGAEYLRHRRAVFAARDTETTAGPSSAPCCARRSPTFAT